MDQHIEQSAAPSTSSFLPSPVESQTWFWARCSLAAAVVVLVGLPLVVTGRIVWGEWQALREEERRAVDTAVVGYPNIYPRVSKASKPDPWFRVEGDTIFVWSGWKQGEGHCWFRAHLGDFERREMSEPIGRDVSQAIDYPMIENGGGPIWERIPGGAGVAGLALGGCSCAYPMTVLGKVLIVNDVIEDRPYLIHLDPFHESETPVSIFDARLEGHRITLGSSGLMFEGRHVLYDRGTESLWSDEGRGLVAFAGKYKGKELPLVTRVSAVAWDDWRDSHPGARLLIGSVDRKRGMPPE
ncbi:DUF3179 domain-containing (seleno)protein [Paludisphaera borealis]|uniref:DUF3179 domain-containing protein n=1 Tax=Paludisphaera borealis TaxID=1387353 RepID=A0A1U7CMU3_9BACT|nr:DUF3179 domain-containing (seleno)protein [Paludisphaera borealis]APW60229.1 hypothetical protein BSF38_01696 [Paludisphaera borealis]